MRFIWNSQNDSFRSVHTRSGDKLQIILWKIFSNKPGKLAKKEINRQTMLIVKRRERDRRFSAKNAKHYPWATIEVLDMVKITWEVKWMSTYIMTSVFY